VSWVKVDDLIYDHPKFWMLDSRRESALFLYVFALCWCSRNLSDGEIPKSVIHVQKRGAKTTCEKMVEVGLFEDNGRSYMVHDYLKYNRSREQVTALRTAASHRKERWKEQRRNAVPNKTTDTERHKDIYKEVLEGFTEAWNGYPRKVGKPAALKAFHARTVEGVPQEELVTAAKNYGEKRRGEDPQYTMLPATFFGPNERWKEYIELVVDVPSDPSY